MSQSGFIVAHKMTKPNVITTVEKKYHTVKNTVMSTVEKVILYLGQTFTGRNHDYSMLKQEFPPDQDWFVGLDVLVD